MKAAQLVIACECQQYPVNHQEQQLSGIRLAAELIPSTSPGPREHWECVLRTAQSEQNQQCLVGFVSTSPQGELCFRNGC